MSSNGSVDYFGQTVNVAARFQATAEPGRVCISADVYTASGVAGLLADVSVEREAPIIKGVTESIPVYRLVLR